MTATVIALGGNALTKTGQTGTADELATNAAEMADALAALAGGGHRLIISHGNGPQVGNLAIQQHEARHKVPGLPLDLLGAMTQGYMGSMIIRALWDRLPSARNHLAAMVTHVVVAPDDAAFERPSKPVGPFLSEAEAQEARAHGWHVREDAGRGLRRVVPSPKPCRVIEAAAIKSLVDAGFLVVAGGGGGIPTIDDAGSRLLGVEAVIDKDRLAVQIALAVEAEVLAIVTGVDQVMLGFGTDEERPIAEMTAVEAGGYLAAGEFPDGSMGPKIEAAIEFVQRGGDHAIVTSPKRLVGAVRGEGGTWIVRADE